MINNNNNNNNNKIIQIRCIDQKVSAKRTEKKANGIPNPFDSQSV